jgi:AraC-like DNA-binding protein
VFIGEKKIHLRKGYLYLIPSFTHCSYICESEMSHYYATFTIQLPNNLSIYQMFHFHHEIEATEEFYEYFEKLHKVNPNMLLPAKDPKIYQRINSNNWNNSIEDAERSLITSGLLYLLLSKFIDKVKIDLEKGDANPILAAIKHIHTNLNNEITISNLAEMSCLSTGHFTKKFKEITQLTPLDYINKQRIEKAQLLLHTTNQPGSFIADACGYKSNAYFCKIFKKNIGISPNAYRNNQVSENSF